MSLKAADKTLLDQKGLSDFVCDHDAKFTPLVRDCEYFLLAHGWTDPYVDDVAYMLYLIIRSDSDCITELWGKGLKAERWFRLLSHLIVDYFGQLGTNLPLRHIRTLEATR